MNAPDIGSGLACGSVIVFRNKVVDIDEEFASLFGFTSLVDLSNFISSPLHLVDNDFQQKILAISLSDSFESDTLDPNGEIFSLPIDLVKRLLFLPLFKRQHGTKSRL
ncbi:hypothetical protein [Vibrio algarum]|uniref:Uncharacterized protein n=1 Tax=Vibrio algarum TaxID=3020714 RepID=A0ABT4YT06_9VIBR|nr:hypothetical protein [Vibrio sp. KJ40-1]MDB1124500.1 hypothetical protein [Vibrio sp. KJ40-1]